MCGPWGPASPLVFLRQVSFAMGQKMLKEERVFNFCYFSISLCYTRPNRQSLKLVLKLPLPHDLAFNRNQNTIFHAKGKTLIAFNLQT